MLADYAPAINGDEDERQELLRRAGAYAAARPPGTVAMDEYGMLGRTTGIPAIPREVPLAAEPARPARQPYAFPAPAPRAGPVYAEPPPPAVAAAPARATESLAPLTAGVQRMPEPSLRGAIESQLGRRPSPEDYPAAQLHGWRKALAPLFVGMAAFGNPAAGERAYEHIYQEPRQRAKEQYQAALTDYNQRFAEQLATAREEREEANVRSEIAAREREKPTRPETLDREAYDYYVSQGMTPAAARRQVLADAAGQKQRVTNPFEAFAYGTPQEKQAAQDFLTFEKETGERFRRPTEFEERFNLFKSDPDTYRAMFGDKPGAANQAQADKMLRYLDGRRKEINADLLMEDEEKQRRLGEIDQLEQPFLEAAGVGGGQPGAAGDKVRVIHPDGTPGTVPRANLDRALKRGYRLAK